MVPAFIMPKVGKVNKIQVREHDIEWKIMDFFSHLEKDGECYTSPPFSFDGASWFLGMDPNGDSYNDSFGYVNLYLYRESAGPSINLRFSLSLKTVNGRKDPERICTGAFEQWKNHQLLRFISRSELVRRKAELVPSGILTVVCRMKKQHFAENSSDVVIGECSYCKEIFESEVISFHEKKCLVKPIKCPECSDVILLQNWYDHECLTSRAEGKSNISGAYVVAQKNKILQDFKLLFCNQEDSDVVINVKGQEFPAHRAILKVRSPVFASTFRSDMKEKLTGIINIEDCGPSAFSEFLCFLYCGDVENLSQENVFDIFSLSDKYDVPDLKEISMKFVKANLSIDTFCETITLGVRHTEIELIKLATDFFIKNAQEIIKTVKWQSFLAENPTQSNELFIKLLASNNSLNA